MLGGTIFAIVEAAFTSLETQQKNVGGSCKADHLVGWVCEGVEVTSSKISKGLGPGTLGRSSQFTVIYESVIVDHSWSVKSVGWGPTDFTLQERIKVTLS